MKDQVTNVYWKDGTVTSFKGGDLTSYLASNNYPVNAIDLISHTGKGPEIEYQVVGGNWERYPAQTAKVQKSIEVLQAASVMAESIGIFNPLKGLLDAPAPTPEQRAAAAIRDEKRDEIQRHNLKVELARKIKKSRSKLKYQTETQHGLGVEVFAQDILLKAEQKLACAEIKTLLESK